MPPALTAVAAPSGGAHAQCPSTGPAGTDPRRGVLPVRNLATSARWHRLAVALMAGVVLWEALWELSLAPLRPGGSWLVLKVVPIAWVWILLVRGSRRARQVASLMLPLFAAEGIVRALTEPGRHAYVATLATALALGALVAILLSFRSEKRLRQDHSRRPR